MPVTRVADVVAYDQFLPYQQLYINQFSPILSSGAVNQSPLFASLASGSGETINFPYWNDLTGDSEVLSDTVPLSPQGITATADKAVIYRRGKSWGSNDLAGALAGDDPDGAIAMLTARWWARDIEKTFQQSLKGIFASTSMSGAVNSIRVANGTATPTTASRIGFGPIVDTLATLGDQFGNLGIMLMHSATYFSLLKSTEERIVPASSTQPFATYMGIRVVIGDTLPVDTFAGTANAYHTYLFGPGALSYGEGTPVGTVLLETERDALAGEDRLVNRKHFVFHLNGVKWTGDSLGSSPNNTELATGTNWARVYERKNLPVALLIHNI